jgi:hypothetical protein
MYLDATAVDRSKIAPSPLLSDSAGNGGVEDQKGPSPPDTQANPEFAKWWRRWASRVRRISVRRNQSGRGIKLDPRRSDPRNSPPKAVQGMSTECEFQRYL